MFQHPRAIEALVADRQDQLRAQYRGASLDRSARRRPPGGWHDVSRSVRLGRRFLAAVRRSKSRSDFATSPVQPAPGAARGRGLQPLGRTSD